MPISFIGRLLARLVFTSISIMPVALGWLFAPLHFQDGATPLISVFDAEVFPIAVQVKRFSQDYLAASNEGLLQKNPLGEIKINPVALWALGSDAAIGFTNPPNPEMVVAVRLDNLSWSAVKLAHSLANELLTQELKSVFETDNFVIAFAGQHLVLGTNPKLIENVIAHLGADAPTPSDYSDSSVSAVSSATSVYPREELSNDELLTIQSRGILGRFRLSGAWRREWGIAGGGEQDLISCALTRVGEEFHLRLRYLQGLGSQQKPSEVFPIERLNAFLEQAPPPLKKGEVVAIEAMVDPDNLRQLASSRSVVEDPLQQAQRDIIEKAVLPYADGRFSFRFMESPGVEEVLPVPEIRGAIGTTNSKAMSNALEKYIGKLINIFREPGGNELWEAVRQDTCLYPLDGEHPGARIHLHPLFFHKLEPYWFYEPGTDRLADTNKIEWGTHFSKDYFVEPTSIQTNENGLAVTNLHASWHLPPEEIEKWKELFLDKAEKHNWMPQATLAEARETMNWAEKTGKLFPSGSLALSVMSKESDSDNNIDPAFYLDIHAVFRIRVGD